MIAGVLLCTLVFAGGTPDEKLSSASGMAVLKKGNAMYQLLYKSAATSRVSVTIRDERGAVVFREDLTSSEGFARPYNFENLETGAYTFTVEDKFGSHTEKIRHGEQQAAGHVMKLAGAEKKFLVTYAAKGSKRVRVNIYDANDDLLHTEAYNAGGDYARVFNLKNVEGAVTFEFSTGGSTERIRK
ncbi:MAG: hypothetical protein K1X47_15805 [Cyclobacteriaceae bacterium]|nr:hypothetical protein [Cyclobacteriaceae bacterium]